ncbi:MAG: hypothetical protein AAFU49_17085 [Pseudomonadota bacterium]
MSWRHLLGLAAAIGLAALVWAGYDNYLSFARFDQLTGLEDLRWLRPWLTEFRMPLLGVAGFLMLSVASWLLKKLGVGV